MQNALLIGLSRQVALERELGVVANNIANVNTNGFKSDGTVFEEYIGPTARESGVSLADSRVSFVHDRATWLDLSQGAIDRTGNSLDVAISGSGYFAVQTPVGERYTRNGAFQINASGELVTSNGYQVLGDGGPIKFQSTDHDVHVSADGTISVQEGDNNKTESQRGKLRMVGFDRPERLQKDGSSMFVAPPGVTAQTDTTSSFMQGSLEKSNVRAVVEMTRMIEVTRSYTQMANMLSQQSDLQRTSIEKLADVPN